MAENSNGETPSNKEKASNNAEKETRRGLFGRKKKPGRKKRRVLRFLLLTFFAISLIGAIAAASGGYYLVSQYAKDIPNLEDLSMPGSKLKTQVFAKDGQLLAELYLENREIATLDEIPTNLANAFVAIEDERFYKHNGFDLEGMGRAISLFLKSSGDVKQGASTITQQLARNIFLLDELKLEDDLEDKLQRKLREIIMSVALEKKYSKEEILERYMNVVYLGHGAHGVKTAAKIYFGKNLEDLTLAECAMMGALLKAPGHYTPYFHPERAMRRRDAVLAKMLELGFISPAEYESASLEGFNLSELTGPAYTNYKAPYFVTYLIDQLLDPEGEFRFTATQLFGNGYKIYTTLEYDSQTAAEEAVEYGIELGKERDANVTQGALISMRPQTGAIVAMVGGVDFENSKFNRTYQSLRQPGSSFKTFVYTTAVEQGYSMETVINDSPSCFPDFGKRYCPKNYDHRYKGPMTFHTALKLSRNVPAVKAGHIAGLKNVVETAKKMGITTKLSAYASLPLGAFEVRMIDMAAAYGSLASGGYKVNPYGIEKITTMDNIPVYHKQIGPGEKILQDNTVARMVPVLEDVIISGTGRRADIGRPAAGKTGTTNNYQDAWFVGFTPTLVTAVWYGNDDNSHMKRIGGGTIPAPVWGRYMKEALADELVRDFDLPEPIVMDAAFVEIAEEATGPVMFDLNRLALYNNPQPLPEGEIMADPAAEPSQDQTNLPTEDEEALAVN